MSDKKTKHHLVCVRRTITSIVSSTHLLSVLGERPDIPSPPSVLYSWFHRSANRIRPHVNCRPIPAFRHVIYIWDARVGRSDVVQSARRELCQGQRSEFSQRRFIGSIGLSQEERGREGGGGRRARHLSLTMLMRDKASASINCQCARAKNMETYASGARRQNLALRSGCPASQ